MVEAEKRLFQKREALFGDPDFFPKVTEAVRELIDPAFAQKLRASIGERATPAEQVREQREHGTSHISVVDEDGNAVALTTTVNYLWGSTVVPPGTGVVMNDQMDDFDIAPGVANVYGLMGTEANAIAPGKVPLSSMSPTIVFDSDGEVRLVVGAPGGSTIPTTVAQVISHIVDDAMPVDQALTVSRIHHQLHPDEVFVEADGLEAATAAALRARGHKLTFGMRGGARTWGNAQAVTVDPRTGWRAAASDPRGSGAGAIP
jgi:gamma-glutamyltranspeptidase/glutathione hydrolase